MRSTACHLFLTEAHRTVVTGVSSLLSPCVQSSSSLPLASLSSAWGVDYRANPVGSYQAAIRGTIYVELPGCYQKHKNMEL